MECERGERGPRYHGRQPARPAPPRSRADPSSAGPSVPGGAAGMSYADVPCQQAVTVLTEYMEGALDVENRSILERHLAWCDWCETYLEQLRDTTRAIRSLQDDTPA